VATLGDYIRHLQEVGQQSDQSSFASQSVESSFDHICPNQPILTCNCADPNACAELGNDPDNIDGNKRCPDSGRICNDRSCPSETWSDWQVSSSTCTQNPPTCQVTTETQTLSCPSGYTGSNVQTRSSTCPDPYGSPVWQPWVTTSDTCKKSINNPTNPMSPISPLNPASNTSALTIQSLPVTVQTPDSVPNLEITLTVSTEDQTETTTDSQTTSSTRASPPAGKVRSVVGLAWSLELFVKPGLQQPNVFPEVQIVQGLPNDVLFSGQLLVDVYGRSMPDQSGLFNRMSAEAVELEQ